MMRSRSKKRERRLTGGVWIEGTEAQIAVAVGPAEKDRGRLVELHRCQLAELDDAIAVVEASVRARESASVAWVGAITGADCIVESCLVPREVAHAPLETRAIACLAGTAWGDADAAAEMELALAYQIDGERCLIAAARESAVAAARDAIAARAMRVTSEAVALAELVKAAHPAASRAGSSATLALHCSARRAAFVVLDAGVPVVARQVALEAARTAPRRGASASAARPANAGPLDFETGDTRWAANDFVPPAREEDEGEIDAPACHAGVLAEVRETLALYRECGGYASDIRTVLVTGPAVEQFDLTVMLPHALGSDFDVIELEASRIVTTNDPELAGEVAEHEATLSGVLALVAAGRRADLLAFRHEHDAGDAFGEVPVRAPRRTLPALGRNHARIAAALMLFALAGGGASAARYVWAERGLAETRHAVDVERRRAEELKAIATERAENEARYKHATELVNAVDSLRARQRAPVMLLADISSRLPQNAGLTRVALDGADVSVTGASETAADADQFAMSLQMAAGKFADVTPATEADRYTVAPTADAKLPSEERPLERFTVRARFLPAVAGAAERAVFAPK